jgi:predicted RNA polymerase sigma factor
LRDDASLKGLVDAPMSAPSLKSYHLLPSVRGGLLAKLGISVISPVFGPSKPKA